VGGKVHGSQDEIPGGRFTALVHAVQKWLARRGGPFRSLVNWQITEGTHGLVPVGTTGESPTVSHDEHKRVVEWCVDEAKGRVPVIAGAAPIRPREAIRAFPACGEGGRQRGLDRDAAYYNKPTQEGMYQHFKAINDAINIPIIIYNIPPRSVIDMSVDTIEAAVRAEEHCRRQGRHRQNGAGMSQQRAAMGEDFNQLSGEDATVLGYMAHGGHGCISVTSNVAPRLCSEFHLAWQKGDVATALKLHDKLMPLHNNLFIESNPAPIKYAIVAARQDG